MTVAVLGLDGADYELVRKWDCGNILLDNHAHLETFANIGPEPRTSEVWPTIATGEMPEGDEYERGSDWSGITGIADSVAKKFVPSKKRAQIGAFLRSGYEVYYEDSDSMFKDGVVWNWPGVTPAENWSKGGYWWRELKDSGITNTKYERVIKAMAGQEIGWLLSMSSLDVPIVGVHVHYLDHAGHAWANHPEILEQHYKHADSMVATVRDAFDDLVILSDHGMRSPVTDNEDIANHSFRAMISSTVPGELPAHVADVREWVESIKPAVLAEEDSESTFDATEEQLRSLGYME